MDTQQDGALEGMPEMISISTPPEGTVAAPEPVIAEPPVPEAQSKQTESELKQLLISTIDSLIPTGAIAERRGFIIASVAEGVTKLLGKDAELKSGAHVKVIEPMHEDHIHLAQHVIREYEKRRDHLSEVGKMMPTPLLRRFLDEHASRDEARIIAKILRDDVQG